MPIKQITFEVIRGPANQQDNTAKADGLSAENILAMAEAVRSAPR